MHLAAGPHQPDGQCLLYGQAVATEIMAGDDLGLHTDVMQIGTKTQSQRLDAPED